MGLQGWKEKKNQHQIHLFLNDYERHKLMQKGKEKHAEVLKQKKNQ